MLRLLPPTRHLYTLFTHKRMARLSWLSTNQSDYGKTLLAETN